MKKQTQEPQQVNQQPQDIGKLNITNVILWILKNAHEQKPLSGLRRNSDI